MNSNSSRRPQVVVAEDDAVFRYTVKLIIEERCQVVGEAADGATAVQLADELHPDVVPLDISMPVMTGLEAARLIRMRLPDIRVIIVSNHTAPECIEEAFRIGAHGYVVKETATFQLPKAIQDLSARHSAERRTGIKRETEHHNALPSRVNDLQPEVAPAGRAIQMDRNTVATLQLALAYAQSIVDTVREPMRVLDGTLHIRTASRAFYSAFGVSHEDPEGRFIYDLGNGQWEIPELHILLEAVIKDGKDFQDFEVTHDFPQLGRRVMLINARRLWTEESDSLLVLMAIEDVTERKRIHDELVRSNEDLQRFAYVAAHDLRSPLNAALNLSRLLAMRTEEKLDEREREMVRLSIESLERLGELMNEHSCVFGIGKRPGHVDGISVRADSSAGSLFVPGSLYPDPLNGVI